MNRMKKTEFLLLVEQLLGCEAGTLKGPEPLADVAGWDSLAAVGFLALIDDKFGVTLSASRLQQCRSVDDLLGLAADYLQAA